MKTPRAYSDNLKKDIITDDMLGACIYSVNKRAKNYRDKVHKLYSELDYVRSIYGQTGTDYQWQNIRSAEYTRDQYYEYKDKLLSIVDPVAIHMESPGDRYYLLYKVGGYSFHRPLDKGDLEKYPDLPREDIGVLTTQGRAINDLISVQFVMKVLCVIRRGNYTYQYTT